MAKRALGKWIVMLIWLLVISGCSPAPEVDPALFVKDSFSQTMMRYVRPSAYWTEKVQVLERVVADSSEAFRISHRRYRQAIQDRQNDIKGLVPKGVAGTSPSDLPVIHAKRKAIIAAHRANLTKIRQESHALRKVWRQNLIWLSQAQHVLAMTR